MEGFNWSGFKKDLESNYTGRCAYAALNKPLKLSYEIIRWFFFKYFFWDCFLIGLSTNYALKFGLSAYLLICLFVVIHCCEYEDT